MLRVLCPLISIIVATSCSPVGRGCELQDNEFPDLLLTTRGVNIIRADEPVTLSCEVTCSSVVLTNCGLKPHWYVSVKADGYQRHSLVDGIREAVLQSLMVNNTDIVYERYDNCNKARFNLTLISIGEHDEVLVLCGLERDLISHQDDSWAVVRKYVPTVSSSQIKQSPAVLIEEGDDASVTCERPLNESTNVLWTLSGSRLLQREPIALNDSMESVLLTGGKEFGLMFDNFTKNCNGSTSDEDLMCFRLTILALTQDLTGLTVGCSESMDKEEELSAVIVVVPKEIFSDQPRNLTVKEGDDISLSCKRSNGTQAEWQFLFENGESLLYPRNASTLESRGFSFHDPPIVKENLRTFGVNVIVNKAMHNLTITCAAKNTENNSTKFNKFADRIVILNDEGGISRPSSSASPVAIATATPLVAVIVLAGIVVVTIIAKHFGLPNRRATSTVVPAPNTVIPNPNIENDEEISELQDAGAAVNGEVD